MFPVLKNAADTRFSVSTFCDVGFDLKPVFIRFSGFHNPYFRFGVSQTFTCHLVSSYLCYNYSTFVERDNNR